MGCNNTLTDAQLKAMFATTDEEMRQIEQAMECLIERTQHKCKSVPYYSPTKLRSSNTTMNLPPKRRNAPSVVKPLIALITWRST